MSCKSSGIGMPYLLLSTAKSTCTQPPNVVWAALILALDTATNHRPSPVGKSPQCQVTASFTVMT